MTTEEFAVLAIKLPAMSTEETAVGGALPVAPLTTRAALRWPLIRQGMKLTRPITTLEIGAGQGAMGARLALPRSSFLAVHPDVASFGVAKERIEARGGRVRNCLSDDLEDGKTFDMVCAWRCSSTWKTTRLRWHLGLRGYVPVYIWCCRFRLGSTCTASGTKP